MSKRICIQCGKEFADEPQFNTCEQCQQTLDFANEDHGEPADHPQSEWKSECENDDRARPNEN
jgi:predicted amidophosphoribosyltransferase